MKKTKIMSIMLTVLLIALFSMNCVMAFSTLSPTYTNDDKLTGSANKIIGAIQVVGYLIAAGMIVYIGVKYIMASASEKAELKGLLIKYVIGAILIIFGCVIAGWIFSITPD